MPSFPITRVTLFKHGVGAFERQATVSGSASLELSFKQDEVSDVLKSLTVLDLDGGQIHAIAYDSTKPIAQMLSEVALSIPDQNSLTTLLPQLKGAAISVVTPGFAPMEGSLLGIDTCKERSDTGQREIPMLSLLTASGEVHAVPLFTSTVVLKDPAIQRDLQYFLRTTLSAKKKETRVFRFQAHGEGDRHIVVNYVVAAPVWKATYRMILGEGDQPLLQGWAVVDNMQEEDWKDVQLTLVAGLPVSFQHDLYSARYITRPVVEVAETAGVLPPEMMTNMLGMMSGGAAAPARPVAQPLMAKRRHMESLSAPACYEESYALHDVARSSTPVQVRERQVGELFEYQIAHPVSIDRNQSALVPIVQKEFHGRSVLYYQREARQQNPLRAVEFRNSTGLTLEGGPVTVFQQGSYAGEAMLDTTVADDLKFVSYAVELSVKVETNVKQEKGAVTSIIIANGVARLRRQSVNRVVYTVKSKLSKEETLFIEHPRYLDNGKLRYPAADGETTDTGYRLRFTLPPQQESEFLVEEVADEGELMQLVNLGLGDMEESRLLSIQNQRFMPVEAKKQLQLVIEARAQLRAMEKASTNISLQMALINEQQKRLRDNLQVLGDRSSEKELRDRYVRSLVEQEDEYARIQKEQRDIEKEIKVAKERLNEQLRLLTVEAQA
jgi:hypothetical protein